MRVIAGAYGGRTLKAPPGDSTRPTSDRVRESLFSILGETVQDADVLDLFAGSGALSFECLSRGARHALLFERDRDTARLIRGNAEALGLASTVDIRQEDFLMALTRLQGPFDLVFLDPPYASGLLEPALMAIGRAGILSDRGILVAEHSSRETLPEAPEGLYGTDRRLYGAVGFTFYRKRGSDEDLGIPGEF